MNKSEQIVIPEEVVMSKIYEIRGKKVMLDRDLAELYGVKTKRLKEQVRRNLERFPERYMFELTIEELNTLRSQFATSKKRRGGTRYLPMAFTEHGILQLANALKSGMAIQMSIKIIDVFVRMREMLLTQKDLLLEMEEIRKKVSGQDEKIALVFSYLKQFIKEKEIPRKKIGFK
ncbi:MAG: ORF6N domain-containing protein [Flavobacteriales bacterium]|nr:ORF6N domain-containing protein [Flavobacteriales bacterium]